MEDRRGDIWLYEKERPSKLRFEHLLVAIQQKQSSELPINEDDQKEEAYKKIPITLLTFV